MQAVEHRGQTRVLMSPFCANIMPVTDDGSLTFSYWKPSLREWFGLMFGRSVELCTIGSGQPPVWLEVKRVPS